MCACYVVKKTWQREDVIVAALTAFFRLQRNQILSLGVFCFFTRKLRDSWSRMAALSAGAGAAQKTFD